MAKNKKKVTIGKAGKARTPLAASRHSAAALAARATQLEASLGEASSKVPAGSPPPSTLTCAPGERAPPSHTPLSPAPPTRPETPPPSQASSLASHATANLRLTGMAVAMTATAQEMLVAGSDYGSLNAQVIAATAAREMGLAAIEMSFVAAQQETGAILSRPLATTINVSTMAQILFIYPLITSFQEQSLGKKTVQKTSHFALFADVFQRTVVVEKPILFLPLSHPPPIAPNLVLPQPVKMLE
ncbi:hypothetical protein N7490_011227 [Penicillium lividum]|nr:hypothetical protein N7490_011227 [Penicillium lividum]